MCSVAECTDVAYVVFRQTSSEIEESHIDEFYVPVADETPYTVDRPPPEELVLFALPLVNV